MKPTSSFVDAARRLALDRQAVEITQLLLDRGIPSLLLKGPAVSAWLGSEVGERTYADVDLLVPLDSFTHARDYLVAEGFHDITRGLAGLERADHADTLSGPSGMLLDLHRSVNGVPPSPACFEILYRGSKWLTLPEGRVRVCRPAAQLFVLILHAAQHGMAEEKPRHDLVRAAEIVKPHELREAASIADNLAVSDAFNAGLSMCRELLAIAPGVGASAQGLVVKARAAGAHKRPGVIVVASLLEARGVRRLKLLGRVLWPTRALLEARYGTISNWGILLRRAQRLLHLAWHLPRAVRSLRKLVRND